MVATFKERLNEASRFFDIPQKELADMIGVSKALMNQYFKGQSSPKDLNKVVKLAEIFKVSPAWLIGFDVPRIDYTYEEKEFIKKLRRLNSEGISKIRNYLEDILDSPKNLKIDESDYLKRA